jgi:hypothetical protein
MKPKNLLFTLIAFFVIGFNPVHSQTFIYGYSDLFTIGEKTYEYPCIIGYSGVFEMNNMGEYISGYSNFFMLNTIGAQISGLVTDQQTGEPVEGAVVKSLVYSSLPTNEAGEYNLSVPFGYGYTVYAVASDYQTQYFYNVNVPEQSPQTVVNFQLSFDEVEAELIALNPNPNPMISKVQQGGTLHRYYKIINDISGNPAAQKSILVAGEGFSKNFYSNENGIVDIEIQSSEIGNGQPNSIETFTIVSLAGEPLAEPVVFSCEVVNPEYSKYWEANSWINAGYTVFSGNVENTGTITLQESDPQIDDPEQLLLNRKGRTGGGVSFGAGFGLEITAGEVEAGGYAGADASAYASVITEDDYGFEYANISFQDKYASFYLMLDAFSSRLDIPTANIKTKLLEKLLDYITGNVIEDAGVFESSGFMAGAGINGSLTFGFLSNNFEKDFSIGNDFDASASVNRYYTWKNFKTLDALEATAGISLEASLNNNKGLLDIQPIVPIFPALLNLFPESFFEGRLVSEVSVRTNKSNHEIEQIRLNILNRNNGQETLKIFTIVGESAELLKNEILTISNLSNILLSNSINLNKNLFSSLMMNLFSNILQLQNNGEDIEVFYEEYLTNYFPGNTYSFNLGLQVISLGAGSGIEEGNFKLKEKGMLIKGNRFILESYNNSIPELESELPIKRFAQAASFLSVLNTFYSIASLPFPLMDNDEFYVGDQGSYLTFNQEAFPSNLDSITCTSWGWYGNSPSKKRNDLTDRDKFISEYERKRTEQNYGMTFGYGGFYQFEPYGTELLDTCWMTIVYDQEEVDSIDESSLGMYWEDKANQQWVYLGGVLDTVENTVTAPITELSLFTLAPAMPYGNFGLNAVPDSIYADSISTAIISSDTIFNNNLTPVSDGERFTVNTTYGKVITADADTAIDGIQVIAANHQIQFEVQSNHIGGKATVSAFSVNGSANASTELRFYDTIPPAAPLLAEAIPDSTTAKLFWQPNTEDDLSGYVLYFDTDTIPPFDGIHTVYGQPSPIYTGTDTSRRVYGLFNDSTYYFTLTAVDVEGNESDYSNFVQATPWAPERQTIQLAQGWSGISSYINPEIDNVESMFQGVLDELIILQNNSGMFWPGQNVNTLGTWNTHEGYKIKVADTVELTISGSRETNKTLQLSAGWNLIPVLSECAVDVEALFAGEDLVMVKEVAGWNLYWPEYGINTLGGLLLGKAYFVLMGNEGEIVFPECDGANRNLTGFGNLSEIDFSFTPWSPAKPTASAHAVALPASVAVELLLPGDIIGVFDQQGNCSGLGIWQGESTAITLFGNDPTTEVKDGFDQGEPLQFKLYRPGSGEEFKLDVTFDSNMPNPDQVFNTHGLSAIKELKAPPSGIDVAGGMPSVSIIPNPAREEFRLIIGDEDFREGKLSIHAMDGRVAKTVQLFEQSTLIGISELNAGVYILRIECANHSLNKRMVKY